MSKAFLEVTYRKGKPFAAYLSFPRQKGDTSARVEVIDSDFNVDYTADGRPIGIEILNPTTANLEMIQALTARIDAPAIDARDLSPLAAVA